MQNVNMKRCILLLVGLAVSNSILARENPVFGPIHNAIEAENASRVKEILENTPKALNAPDNMGYLPLHTAAKVGSAEIARILIDNGANVNQVAQLVPPEMLERAERRIEKIEKREEAEKRRDDSPRVFWKRRLLPTARGQREEHKKPITPLQLAAMQNNYEVAKVLVNNGADTNIAKNDLWPFPPLHAAVFNRNVELLRLLINNDADVNLQHDRDRTPLHYAVPSMSKKNDQIIRILLENDADPNLKNQYGQTPLHEAAYVGDVDTVTILLKHDANPNLQNKEEGWTPLHEAIVSGSVKVVRMLLKSKANPNIKTEEEGWTPLHIAAGRGDAEMVRILLDRGANPKAKDKSNETPLDFAQELNRTKVVKILKNV